MTVKKYLAGNPDKAAYTIKQGRKSYLCNLLEAYQVSEIKRLKRLHTKKILMILLATACRFFI